MKYIVESEKTIEQLTTDLEAAVKQNAFGVLHIHDLQATLNNKGLEFQNACKVFEVCNPYKAKQYLAKI